MHQGSSILFLTVGGSHQPLVTAIRGLQPARVIFFCTESAPGQRGSRSQVDGKGLCIKTRPQDDKPTLPNIPAQCGLEGGSWDIVAVPGDDLDGAYRSMADAIEREAAAHPRARLLADYTGGTKTMSAALVLAALSRGTIELNFVAGARGDLVKVRDGTQMVAPVAMDAIRLEREMTPFLACWQRYAYDEAARGLAALRVPAQPELRNGLMRAIHFSEALSAWDLFDHAAAFDRLGAYDALASNFLGPRWAGLRMLASTGAADARGEGLRIWDLWLNAQRRAAAGRYDDAVARAYRMLEWGGSVGAADAQGLEYE